MDPIEGDYLIVECKECGKSVKRTPSSIKKSKNTFCSGMCREIFYKKNPKEKKDRPLQWWSKLRRNGKVNGRKND